jgi:putative flippase GtrA
MSSNEDKTGKQFLKFLIIGAIGSVIQIATVNILFQLLKNWKAPLPAFLASIFNESVMGKGNDNWGYLLPFFASQLLSNTYSYIHNMKGNFKTDAPKYYFAIYLALLVVLIVVATWLSGVIANFLMSTKIDFFAKLGPTIGSFLSSVVYTLILFPVEKFILFRKK